MSEQPTQPQEEQAGPPVCPRHPGTVSYVRCQRCERPVCPQCQVPAPVGVWCVDCTREHQRATRTARSTGGWRAMPATVALIAVNVAVYVYGVATGEYALQFKYGMVPMFTAEEPWRLVTAGFVHGGLIHIALNMFMLFQFGAMMERVLGTARFIGLYAASLVGSSVAIQLLAPDVSIHVGASGAIFGLFTGAALLLYRMHLPWQSIAAQAGLWLVAGLFISGLSWQGHLGGAVTGLAVTALLILERGRQRKP